MKVRIPGWLLRPSTLAFFQEGRRDPKTGWWDLLHGFFYARWPYLYIGVGTGEHWSRGLISTIGKAINWFRRVRRLGTDHAPGVAEGYHGKVLPLDHAQRLIQIREDIRLEDLNTVIPFGKAKDIILKEPSRILVLDCPCRISRENPCEPVDVCLIVGEPFASFVEEHHVQRSRAITVEEALSILEMENKQGHVHHAFFKDAMLGRYYAICNCCSCCCGAMQAFRNGTPMIIPSGYSIQVQHDRCSSCGLCVESCPFGFMILREGYPSVGPDQCMGCGMCSNECPEGALQLVINAHHSQPLDIDTLLARRAT